MKSKTYRVIATFLTVVMLILSAPITSLTGLDFLHLSDVFATNVYAVSNYTSGDYIYTLDNDEATIASVNSSLSGNVEIPAEIDGYKVVAIGHESFWFNDNLISVSIPDSVELIDVSAFAHCHNLQSVIIGDGVKTIAEEAFYCCYELSELRIGKNVTYIGGCAFYESNLSTVHFTGTIEQWNAISKDGSDLPLDVVFNCDSEKPSYSGFCGDNLTWSFYVETGKLVISGTGEMYDYEWGNSPWNDAEWNEDYAAVKSITINDGVTTIGSYAFSPSQNIQSISIANTVKEIGNYAFFDCTGTTEIIIPDGVISIGDGAFSACQLFENLVIPNSVKDIGHSAFSNCGNLAEITINDNLEGLGEYAFASCDNLKKVNYNAVNCTKQYIISSCEPFYGCSALSEIVIGTKVEVIPDRMFSTTRITEIVIPSNVKIIEDEAFSWCSNLEKVTIEDGVNRINWYAFAGCTALEEIELPKTIQSLESGIFSGCENLELIKWDTNGPVQIEEDSFIDCPKAMICCKENSWLHSYADANNLAICLYDKNGIPSFEIKNDVLISYRGNSNEVFVSSAMKIGYGAFENNEEIKRVELSTAANRIYDSAFKNCSALENVIIPQNVAFIGDDAFEGCDNLTIYGYAGSYAESYAKKHGIDFRYITLTVSAETFEVNVFDTLQLKTDYNIFLNEPDEIIWSYDDNGVVLVNSTGKVTALSSGEAVVTATSSNGLYATCVIKVAESVPEEKGKVSSVTIPDISLNYKTSTTIIPSITVDSGVKYTVTYSSSNPSVAFVDANGKVIANGIGSATITVTVTDEYGNTVSDTCNVEVKYTWWQWIIVIVLFGWIWY